MAEKSEQQKNDDRTRDADLQWLMGDPRGRRVMWELLEQCHVFHSSFTGNSETFFREGERNVGLKYFLRVNTVCPEQYTTMLREHTAEMERKLQQRNAEKGRHHG